MQKGNQQYHDYTVLRMEDLKNAIILYIKINAINTLLLIFTVLFHNMYALVCLQQHKLVNNDSYI